MRNSYAPFDYLLCKTYVIMMEVKKFKCKVPSTTIKIFPKIINKKNSVENQSTKTDLAEINLHRPDKKLGRSDSVL